MNELNRIYAIRTKNKDLLSKSSTVGCVHEIAKKILDKNGIVCGASYNSDFSRVEHIFVETIEDYEKHLSGSKYTDSNLGGIFLKVKEILDANRLFLFIGTPCQIFFLKKFLKKDYENLVTIDLFCNSVIDPNIFKEKIKELKKRYNSEIVSINMRDKRNGWDKFGISIKFKNGKNHFVSSKESEFFKNFITHKITLKKCSLCSKEILHCSDITVGDFWNCKNSLPNFYDKDGVGIISINSRKGKELFKQLNFEKRQLDYSEVTNLKYYGFKNSFNKTVHIFTFLIDQVNYGQKLQAYALQKVLTDFEYRPITYWKSKITHGYSKETIRLFDDFYLKDINATNIKNFKRYSEHDIFAVGSDQVWNQYAYPDYQTYLLSNIKSKNKLGIAIGVIDYSTKKDKHKEVLQKYKKDILDFKAITVREETSIDFLKNIGIESTLMIDPTLLLSIDEWKNFAKKPLFDIPEKYEIVYSLHKKTFVPKTNNKIINVLDYAKKYGIGPREFVWLIQYAEKIYTNSFHCGVLSEMFGKSYEIFDKSIKTTDARFKVLEKIKDGLDVSFYRNKLKNMLDSCVN